MPRCRPFMMYRPASIAHLGGDQIPRRATDPAGELRPAGLRVPPDRVPRALEPADDLVPDPLDESPDLLVVLDDDDGEHPDRSGDEEDRVAEQRQLQGDERSDEQPQ